MTDLHSKSREVIFAAFKFFYYALPVNRLIAQAHFDKVFVNRRLRSFKDSTDFGIAQSCHFLHSSAIFIFSVRFRLSTILSHCS